MVNGDSGRILFVVRSEPGFIIRFKRFNVDFTRFFILCRRILKQVKKIYWILRNFNKENGVSQSRS